MDELVGGPLGANQLFVHYSLKITLQPAAVDLWPEHLEVLDGGLAVLHEKAKRFSLSLFIFITVSLLITMSARFPMHR